MAASPPTSTLPQAKARRVKAYCVHRMHRKKTQKEGETKKKESDSGVKTARVVANGDILIHDALYYTAKKEDGSYDFHENFEYVTPWLKQADLAIGDFEGTISPDLPLAGYPLFNAPESVVGAIKDGAKATIAVADTNYNGATDAGYNNLKIMNDVFKANISYNKSKSKSSVHNETVEKSSLVSGRNMNIKSKNGSITISGTDVKVGNDLDLSAKKDITIKASEENYTSSNSSSQMGIGLSADLSKGKIADLSISKVETKGMVAKEATEDTSCRRSKLGFTFI